MDENNYTPDNGRPVELSGSTFSGIFRAIGGSLILRGVIMIIFGVLLWINPFKTLDILIKIIGIMLIIDAVPLIVSTFRLKGDGRTVTIIPAAIMLILGLLCIFNALGIARIGIVIIGIWQLISGIQSISTAKRVSLLHSPTLPSTRTSTALHSVTAALSMLSPSTSTSQWTVIRHSVPF